MDDLIEALNIFRKYTNTNYPTHCEHDILYIMDVDPNDVSLRDKERLQELGFDYGHHEWHTGFYSYKYGSA